MGEERGPALCYARSHSGDRAGFIQAASELLAAMGTPDSAVTPQGLDGAGRA